MPPEVGVLVVVESGVYWYSDVRGTPALVSLGLEDVRLQLCVFTLSFLCGFVADQGFLSWLWGPFFSP